MTNKYDIFISYSRADLERVKTIKTELERSTGALCWMDLEGIESGEQFENIIISAINRSDTMLFMLSESSMRSEWALDELDFAKRKGKRIVILHLEDVRLSDTFYFRYHKYDQIKWHDKPQQNKLIRDICRWIGNKEESNSSKQDVDYHLPKNVDKPISPYIKHKEESKSSKQDINYHFPRTVDKPTSPYVKHKENSKSSKREFDLHLPKTAKVLMSVLMIAAVVGAGVYYLYESDEPSQEERVIAKVDNPVLQNLIDNMVYVEGGIFWMGAQKEYPGELNFDDKASDNEKPVHQVTISSFWIGKYEVTQEEWEAVMDTNPSEKHRGLKFPVTCVSWNDCQTFVRKLNEKTGLAFRLPTEAEWEYAARGGKNGDTFKYSGSNKIDDVGWYDVAGENMADPLELFEDRPIAAATPHDVGLLAPNSLGLYDMTGNVSEWCQDWFNSRFYRVSPASDPCCEDSVETYGHKIVRGGDYYCSAEFCHITQRSFCEYNLGAENIGLRLALDMQHP